MQTIENPDGSRIITSTIGTNNRDFSTPQAWLDTIPGDLVAIKTKYIGLMYNDSVYNIATVIANRTTSAEFNIELKCAPGHSIFDNALGRQAPLRFDPTQGVAVKYIPSNQYTEDVVLHVLAPYTKIDGIQWSGDWVGGKCLLVGPNIPGVVINRCHIKGVLGHPTQYVAQLRSGTLENSLVVEDSTTYSQGALVAYGGVKLHNVGVVRSAHLSRAGTGISPRYGKVEVINCYTFNYGNAFDNQQNYTTSSGNNACDEGTNDVQTALFIKVPTNDLVQPNLTLGNVNFRPKQGSVLLNAGRNLSDQKTNPTDMYGFVRDEDWDIGPVENIRPADKFVFTTAPTVGYTAVASTPFVLGVNGFLENDIVVTLSSDDTAGVFSPATITLTPAQPSGEFTFTPSKAGSHSINVTSNSALPNPTSPKYLSGSVATQLLWHNTANLAGRAGVDIPDVSITVNGVVEEPVTVTPTDSDGGLFTPTSRVINRDNTVATFTYRGATGGVKSITTSNDKNLQNPPALTATLKVLIAPNPTPSTESLIVKSIGAGKDFSNINEFAGWLNTLDLVAMKQNVLGELYENQTFGQYTYLYPKKANALYNAALQPVPGLEAFRWEEPTDPLDYSTRGIEIMLGAFAIRFGRGMTVRNFLLNIPAGGNALQMQSTSNDGNEGVPVLANNRIKISRTGAGQAIATGEFATGFIAYDNLFIRDGGDGPVFAPIYAGTLQRNTFAARGTGTFSTGAVAYSDGGSAASLLGSVLRDNAFINAGPMAVGGAARVGAGNITNNATDNAMTTAVTGIAEAAAGSLVNSNTDYRPKVGGILEATASTYAIDTIDVRGILRGGLPDIGCIQGATRTPLPLVTITETIVDGNDVIVSGITQWNPTSATAILLASTTDPDGATSYGARPVTLTPGAFSIRWEGIAAGNYQIPNITMVNAGGYNRAQSGGEEINIIPLVAVLVDGEEQKPMGGAPIIKVDPVVFDNNVLTLSGTVDNQGDTKLTMAVFIDPQPTGASTSPATPINLVGTQWGVQFSLPKGDFKIRVVATANGQTTTYTSPLKKLIDYTAAIMLPAR